MTAVQRAHENVGWSTKAVTTLDLVSDFGDNVGVFIARSQQCSMKRSGTRHAQSLVLQKECRLIKSLSGPGQQEARCTNTGVPTIAELLRRAGSGPSTTYGSEAWTQGREYGHEWAQRRKDT